MPTLSHAFAPVLTHLPMCRRFDPFGHPRAACAEAGVLGKRGFPLECPAAQVCREAGARVTTNAFIRDLDLGEFNRLDGRRIEVIMGWFCGRHHVGVTPPPGWVREKESSHPSRNDIGTSQVEEGGHVSAHVWLCLPGDRGALVL